VDALLGVPTTIGQFVHNSRDSHARALGVINYAPTNRINHRAVHEPPLQYWINKTEAGVQLSGIAR
jgi:hypothetical protein